MDAAWSAIRSTFYGVLEPSAMAEREVREEWYDRQ